MSAAPGGAVRRDHAGASAWRWTSPDGRVRAICTDRSWGDMGIAAADGCAAVMGRRRTVAAAGGVAPEDVAGVHQVHGAHLVVAPPAAPVPADVRWIGEEFPDRRADAVVVRGAGRAGAVLTADCVPIVVATGDAVAVVHAGWRGVVDGVLEAALHELGATGGELHALVGPCIGPCCFEVGPEVAEQFPPRHLRPGSGTDDRALLDLGAVVRERLEAAGSTVHVVDACTACDPCLWSYRSDGPAAGRQATLAWISDPGGPVPRSRASA